MISMARIQGSSMGYQNFQKPIIQMGQDGFSAGPIGAGMTPGPGFNGPADFNNQNFQNPAFQTPNPNYAYNVEVPVPVPVPTSTPVSAPVPTWVIVGGSLAAGAALVFLMMRPR
jgi:hypothetical protein